VVYIHGGGWSLGSVNTYDSITRALAQRVPAVVVSVDYRLAPEHPFPAALQDAAAALGWVLSNARELGGDPRRVAVAGDSAGATLATVAAGAMAAAGGTVAHQTLFYPSTNVASGSYPSYGQYGEGHWLTRRSVET